MFGAVDGNKRMVAILNTPIPNLAEGQDFTSIPLTKQKFLNEMEDTLVDCCGDTATFAKVFMPHRFTREFDSPYREIFRLLDDDSAKKVAIAAPRGTGKTSIDAIAFPARKVCYQESKFVLVVSCTHNLAASVVRQLGRELTDNPNIIHAFGPLKGTRWSEGEGELRTSTGISILAKGAGQQVRGLIESTRPDLIIVDDLEDSEPFRIGDAEEYIRKIREWFRADLLNVVDRASKTTRIVYLGTVLGENSLLNSLLESPDWLSTRLELCDDNYETNFPGLMSTPEVIELKDEHEARGELDIFFREYRNLPIAGSTAVFKKEYFKYWDQELLAKQGYMPKAVIVDPAKTVNMKSAYTAIQGVGFSASLPGIFQLNGVNKRLAPEEVYEEAWLMAQSLKTTIIAVEVTSLEQWIEYPFNQFLRLKGFPPITPLKAQGKKPDRIRELGAFYRMGVVYHHPSPLVHDALEAQLLAFPRSKYWDYMDAWAYILKLFNIGELGFVRNDREDARAFEEEIAMLDQMDKAMDAFEDWRTSP